MCRNEGWNRMRPTATGTFGGAPHGDTKRFSGWVKIPNWMCRNEGCGTVCGQNANAATGTFGGAPYGATKR
eukprot:2773728-Pyramimonas_sp.AAC.1